jgi:hypothetical protein
LKKTNLHYQQIIGNCKMLFMKKAADYGNSWAILRMPSVTDLINIKAERIRSIEDKQVNLVGDSIEGEYIGIINYCIIAMILLRIRGGTLDPESLENIGEIEKAYDAASRHAFETMERKNHDYGEAWRKMRTSSITDLIRMKVLRLKQIEDNEGKTQVSEGPEANYIDILNYAVFAMIRMAENPPEQENN